MISKEFIPLETATLLQLAEENVLMSVISGLLLEQKKSKAFRDIGQQRYLSALRAGAIENAEMTKVAFSLDPFFLKSKIVIDAAEYGFLLKIRDKQLDVAEKIKSIMGITATIPSEEGDTPSA